MYTGKIEYLKKKNSIILNSFHCFSTALQLCASDFSKDSVIHIGR